MQQKWSGASTTLPTMHCDARFWLGYRSSSLSFSCCSAFGSEFVVFCTWLSDRHPSDGAESSFKRSRMRTNASFVFLLMKRFVKGKEMYDKAAHNTTTSHFV